MTKRRPLSNPTKHQFMWVPLDGVGKESAIVDGGGAKTPQELYAALVEQLFETRGADAVARLFAEKLREPDPHPEVIATIARWLDPQTDDRIKLVVKRRRKGKTVTKRVNDVAIAKAVKKNMKSRGNKHGDQKKAVREVAKLLGVSKATVLKAIR